MSIIEILQKILDSEFEHDSIQITINYKSRFSPISRIKLTQILIDDFVLDEEVKTFNITLSAIKGRDPDRLKYKNGWYTSNVTIHGTLKNIQMMYEIYGDTVQLSYNTFGRKFKTKVKDFDKSFKTILDLHNMMLRHNSELQNLIKESK